MAYRVRLSRRRALVSGGALAVGLALPGGARAAALVATPRQTAGPFYPETLPLDADNDLVAVQSRSERAAGVVTHVWGRLLAEDGRAIDGALIEIWQCDAFGRYHHPRDRGGRADPNFQGYGRTVSGRDGGYRFRTIRPVAYTGRAPHIHMAVSGAGFSKLITQMYVAGEPENERDWILNAIRDERQRRSVLVPLAPAGDLEAGALAGRFDVVLGLSLFGG
jgi:protocatechuate 3,4-dioxygenase beta subunit